ncbi:hypothetical protein BX600DRAFT_432055 [Xylariales sp. PMI_506]|nr:hypothetical protein BX600DRAFT_432055 [Xylariales sp. PMI_506]
MEEEITTTQANLGLREMIAGLRAHQPGLGLKKLTVEVKQRLPANSSSQIEKKQIKEICLSLDSTTQEVPAVRPRDNEYQAICKEAFHAYRSAERNYYLGLDDNAKQVLFGEYNGPPWYAACHLRHHIEVLLTLKGVKPCTLFASPGDDVSGAAAIFNDLILKCLAPVIDRFNLMLYGFNLKYLGTDVLTSDLGHPGFKGDWVLADTRSDKWPLVQDIFFQPQPERRFEESAVGEALGYPARAGDNTIRFTDETEHQVLLREIGPDVLCVDGMEFYCDGGNLRVWADINAFFRRCADAAKEAGTTLKIDMEGYSQMEETFKKLGLS